MLFYLIALVCACFVVPLMCLCVLSENEAISNPWSESHHLICYQYSGSEVDLSGFSPNEMGLID